MPDHATPSWFTRARYGLFIHYGLYSLLERGEWVWNRESIPRNEYTSLASNFTAEHFDAERLCRMAVDAGMRYVVLTTMHHEGFRLYPTELSDFHIGHSAAAGRDLVAETIAAARKHGLKVGLYHSLNNWYDQPDSVAALEDPVAYKTFIDATHERVRELVTRYNPIEILWYDGWWPFNADGWQAERMNAMVRSIQPHIMFNGRNGLAGDFATPEGHLTAPRPWRPWEACMTLNNSWGHHAGDHDWKTPGQVIDLLASCAAGCGNLLLNISPLGNGAVPQPARRILETVGSWLKTYGEAIYDTDLFVSDPQEQVDPQTGPISGVGDWHHHGPITAKNDAMYLLLRRWPGTSFSLGGLKGKVLNAELMGAPGVPISFEQVRTRLRLGALPEHPNDPPCPVLKITLDRPAALYLTGSLTPPTVCHARYDPCPSDTQH